MLKSIYILKSDYENGEFRDVLSSKFSQGVTILPISDDGEFKVFTLNEAITLLNSGKENELIKAVMDKFSSIKAEFIIIIGSGDELLDSLLARNLRCV